MVPDPASICRPAGDGRSFTRRGDGIMETLQNYGYDIVILMTLGICAVGFLVVANNCIATYSEIQGGRKQWKDLGAMAGVGAVLLVITIWLLNRASDIL